MPRDVGRDARRRRVEAGLLDEVGPVEPGAVRRGRAPRPARCRGGPLRDLDRAVAGEHHCSHGGGRYPGRAGGRRTTGIPGVGCGRWRSSRSSTTTGSGSSWTPTRPPASSRSPATSRPRRSPPAPTAAVGSLAVVALVDLLDAAPPHRRGRTTSSRWPTTRRRCTSTSSTVAGSCDHRAWLDPGPRGVARRGLAGRSGAPPALTQPADAQTPVANSASNDSRRHSTSASGSVTAAGSEWMPRQRSPQYESAVTLTAHPLRGPIG